MRLLMCFLGSILLSGCFTFQYLGKNQFNIEKKWVRNTLNADYLGGKRQHRFSPIITETTIYVANAIDGIRAYDRSSAKVLWRKSIKDGVEGGAILHNNQLLFGASDGFFYSLNAHNGEIRWTYPIHSEGLSAPFAEGGVVYFISGNNVVHAVEIETGKLVWVYTRRDPTNISIRGGSQPNVVGDLVYIGFSDGYLVALKKNTGSVFWEILLNKNKRFRDVDAHPVIDSDKIFISSYDGSLYCLRLDTGQVLWSLDEGGYAEVEIEGNTIFYPTTTGKMLSLDKNSGKVLWTYNTRGGMGTKPVVYNEILIFGEMHGALVFLNKNTGQFIKHFETGWGIASTPTLDLSKNELFLLSGGANLYTLGLSWRRLNQLWPWEKGVDL